MLPQVIESKIDRTLSCWMWKAYLHPDGYGRVRWQGKTCNAHRVVYALLVGGIPTGKQLDHTCRNRRCVNPAHLEPVSQAENFRRGLRNQNTSKTHCPFGHEYTTLNTYIHNSKRYCRECGKRRQLAYTRKKQGDLSA